MYLSLQKKSNGFHPIKNIRKYFSGQHSFLSFFFYKKKKKNNDLFFKLFVFFLPWEKKKMFLKLTVLLLALSAIQAKNLLGKGVVSTSDCGSARY